MNLQASNTGRALRAAIAPLLDHRVSVTVAWRDGAGPLVSLSGVLEGLVEVPGGEEAPLSIVIAGEDIVLWPEDLGRGGVVRSATSPGFVLEFDSGAKVSVDPTD